MGRVKKPFLMKTSLLCPEHLKSNPSPSTGPELERSQPGPGPSSSPEPDRVTPPDPRSSSPSPAFPQRPLHGTQATRLPASPLRSARPDPAQPQPRPEAHTPNRIFEAHRRQFLFSHLSSAHRCEAGSCWFPRRPGKRKS